MMLLQQTQSFLSSSFLLSQNIHLPTFRYIKNDSPKGSISCLHVGINELTQIVHNKVLISAAVSGAIGQISKPFTSVLLYRKEFNLKTALQAGGFPSTHSSAVVATATSLGLERGFADAIFGSAVVYAALIMYDAQGVRREVGNHARTINKVLIKNQIISISSSNDANNLSDTFSKKTSAIFPDSDTILIEAEDFQTKENKGPVFSSTGSKINGDLESVGFNFSQLKESIGHTEIEVIAGAFLGFLVSLAVCMVF